jgi:type I restriction enzyme R subunit
MWTIGFAARSLSAIYLDKPLRTHTLMQTATRANRVFPEKNNGLIVAYVDVFQNLRKALAIYAVPNRPRELPVEEKGALVEALHEAAADLQSFCTVVADLIALTSRSASTSWPAEGHPIADGRR